MDSLEASLIIRQHMALIDEGIGPKDPSRHDALVLHTAVSMGGHLFTTAELVDCRLLDEDGSPGTDANPL